jgi:hypothetical protein
MKKFIFFSLALVFFFVVLVLDIFFNNGGLKQNKIPAITPALNPGEAVSTYSKPTKNEQIELDKSSKLGSLIPKLPYNGSFFSFAYDFSKSSFILTLDKNNIAQGNNNFDVFLKTNGIQDRSWFINLIIEYQ